MAILERFGGYTLSSLLNEDAHDLLQMIAIEAMGRPAEGGD